MLCAKTKGIDSGAPGPGCSFNSRLILNTLNDVVVKPRYLTTVRCGQCSLVLQADFDIETVVMMVDGPLLASFFPLSNHLSSLSEMRIHLRLQKIFPLFGFSNIQFDTFLPALDGMYLVAFWGV